MDGWVGQSTQHAALYNTIQDYIAARCEKLAQGFYTAATWPGIEPRIYDTLVRRSTSKPPSRQWDGIPDGIDYWPKGKGQSTMSGVLRSSWLLEQRWRHL